MASVAINKGPAIPGTEWYVVVTWTGDNSYANDGEPLTLKECGFGPEAVFSHAETLSVENKTEQAVFIPNTALYDGEKVHLFDAATGKELASTKDVSKVVVRFKVYCSSR